MATLVVTFHSETPQHERHADVTYEVKVDERVLAHDVIQHFDRARGWRGLVEELALRCPGVRAEYRGPNEARGV